MPIVSPTPPMQVTITIPLPPNRKAGDHYHTRLGPMRAAVRRERTGTDVLRVVPDRVDVDWLGQAGQRAATGDELPLDACRKPNSRMGRRAGRRMLHGAEWVLCAPGFKRIAGSTDTISGEKTPTTFSRGTVV